MNGKTISIYLHEHELHRLAEMASSQDRRLNDQARHIIVTRLNREKANSETASIVKRGMNEPDRNSGFQPVKVEMTAA